MRPGARGNRGGGSLQARKPPDALEMLTEKWPAGAAHLECFPDHPTPIQLTTFSFESSLKPTNTSAVCNFK